MLQLLWLYWLLALEAFRKHPCLSLRSVLDEDSSRWDSRPAERARAEFLLRRSSIGRGTSGRNGLPHLRKYCVLYSNTENFRNSCLSTETRGNSGRERPIPRDVRAPLSPFDKEGGTSLRRETRGQGSGQTRTGLTESTVNTFDRKD